MTVGTTYGVEFDVYEYEHGTYGETQEFSTPEEARNFKDSILSDEGAAKWIRENYIDGYIELVNPNIYKKTVIVEEVK